MASVVGAVVGIASLFSARKQGKQARKDQKRAGIVESRRGDLQAARARRQQIAESRRLRAQAIAQAEGAGISGGSTIAGVTSSLASQSAANQSFISQLGGFDAARFGFLNSASNALSKQSTFNAIASFSQSATGQELAGKAVSFLKGS